MHTDEPLSRDDKGKAMRFAAQIEGCLERHEWLEAERINKKWVAIVMVKEGDKEYLRRPVDMFCMEIVPVTLASVKEVRNAWAHEQARLEKEELMAVEAVYR